jgi:adenosylmethionine-8-amino-7-oxononanoate aminotransferase
MNAFDGSNLPQPLKPEGKWANNFSYHPMDVELERAEGIHLFDNLGNEYIDASGGPMAVNLGHNDERVKTAITKQMDKFSYVHPVMANGPRTELCNRIASIAPGNLNASYLVSGGSEAVETAMKIARQAQINRGFKEKYKIISNYEAYHGMTLATLAVSGNPGSQSHYDPMLQKFPRINQYSDFKKPESMSREEWGIQSALELENAIHYAGPKTVAAYLATPHGAGCDYGVVPPDSYWQSIREICNRYDVLLIADEVVTGFGRTGQWFAMEHFNVEADLMTTAKGISSLYIPLGAVTVSDEINEPFKEDAYFVHGFTAGGHPLACAAGIAVIDVIENDNLLEHTRNMEQKLFSYKDRLLAHPTVKDVRGWGLFMVSELVKNCDTMEFFEPDEQAEQLFQSLALKNGLVLYGTLYGARRQPAFRRGLPSWICPPLTITEEEVGDMMERFDSTLTEWEKALGI